MRSGSFVALVTPFTPLGAIDLPAVLRLLAHHEERGTTGVVLAGTNGEGVSLSGPEKRELVEFAVQHAGGLDVVCGLATCSITEAVWLSRRAQEAGAIATLATPPFYFRTATQEGVEAWFRALLQDATIPCILYNFPANTGIALSPELVARLFEMDHVIGIKDSSGDVASLNAYLEVAIPRGKQVFVGDERLISDCLAGGGSGTVSGLANSYPRLVSRLANTPSEELQQVTNEAYAAIKKHPQPAVHKHVLAARGLPGGGMRPPLTELSDAAKREVAMFVETFGWE
ncbi:MAG: dihydrodipicolinate synthase family protein [Armatimonadota bacterium]|nr:dihydrodipicolinate synthase family protein [Armatimonadota bacterium]